MTNVLVTGAGGYIRHRPVLTLLGDGHTGEPWTGISPDAIFSILTRISKSLSRTCGGSIGALRGHRCRDRSGRDLE